MSERIEPKPAEQRAESQTDPGNVPATARSESTHDPSSNPAQPNTPEADPKPNRPGRTIVRFTVAAVALSAIAGLFVTKGLPWIRRSLTHVSTDDAFVAGDTTIVGSRITDLVEEVLVHDNDFVEKGTTIVRLDRKPFVITVEQMRADLEKARLNIDQMSANLATAAADLVQARDQVRVGLAGLHEAWRAIQSRQDQVRYRIASLNAEIAGWRSTKADLALALKEYQRVKKLVEQQTATQEELDQKSTMYQSSLEKVKAAEQKVQQARALLALAPDYEHPDRIPDDLDRTDADVRRGVAAGQQIMAQLGISFGLLGMDPESLQKALKELTSKTSEDWFDNVPTVAAAKARVDQARAALGGASFDPSKPYDHPTIRKAQKDLEEAELKLSYTEIKAPVTGVVNRRSVNPGDHVQEGQGLLSIQPLESIYITANFKETQLADIRIGQHVDVYVDAYPDKVFKGRVSGFAPATGAASSLLPPENATGNFVKVVQRLPVRIDLIEGNTRETPLFVGLSIFPEVDVKSRPTGPDGGERLRGATTRIAKREVLR
jgi:membrane fusion protein (multidrug efflux system)